MDEIKRLEEEIEKLRRELEEVKKEKKEQELLEKDKIVEAIDKTEEFIKKSISILEGVIIGSLEGLKKGIQEKENGKWKTNCRNTFSFWRAF